MDIKINPIAYKHLTKVFYQTQFFVDCCCRDCNRLVPVESRFCPYCGERLDINGRGRAYTYDSDWIDRVVSGLDDAEKYAREYGQFIFPKEGIYIIYCKDSFDPVSSPHCYKIGLSDNIQRRINNLSTGNPYNLELVHVIQTDDINWAEGFIHDRLAKHRITADREWFRLGLEELKWLFYIPRLDRPKSFVNQQAILDLLETFPGSQAYE